MKQMPRYTVSKKIMKRIITIEIDPNDNYFDTYLEDDDHDVV